MDRIQQDPTDEDGVSLWYVVFEIRNAHKMLTGNWSQNKPYEICIHVTRSTGHPFTPPFYVRTLHNSPM